MSKRSKQPSSTLINKLRNIRRSHVRALQEIDETFRRFGIEHLLGGKKSGSTTTKKSPAKKTRAAAKTTKAGKATKKAGRRARRKTFAETGDQMILRFVKERGSASTKEIRTRWTQEGRGGKAENNITALVKARKLVRTPIPGKLGSTYSLPST